MKLPYIELDDPLAYVVGLFSQSSVCLGCAIFYLSAEAIKDFNVKITYLIPIGNPWFSQIQLVYLRSDHILKHLHIILLKNIEDFYGKISPTKIG